MRMLMAKHPENIAVEYNKEAGTYKATCIKTGIEIVKAIQKDANNWIITYTDSGVVKFK